jgi:dienelactone hydrolase
MRELAVTVAMLVASSPGMAHAGSSPSFAERSMTLDNGIVGEAVRFASANPRNYQEIIAKVQFPFIEIDAKLFVPSTGAPPPVVIITPGSSGVGPSAVKHAAALTSAGIAVLLIDPFGARQVESTVANQGQFSFAASSYDVLAAVKYLAGLPRIDAERIGALGYSRGGAAVLQAAVTPLSRAVLGSGTTLRAVVAAWPWCGYQFEHPETRPTAIRFLVADLDTWVSAVQCQAYAALTKGRNSDVSIRVFRDAVHGFGNGLPVRDVPDAITALNAPITYLNDEGVFLDTYMGSPLTGVDDTFLAQRNASFLSRGTRAGSKDDQAEQFLQDMLGFFQSRLIP